MQIKKILLTQIVLEDPFRKNVEDLSLQLSLSNTQHTPLIVEGPTEDHKYILVEGYRRFHALQQIHKTEVTCIIEPLTNEVERVAKRVKTELHRKKKTGYELERMIKFLLDRNLTVQEIARRCEKGERTISKYFKGIHIDPEIIRIAEENRVGRHALTDLYKLQHTKEEVKDHYISKYIYKDSVTGAHVESFKRVDAIDSFKHLPIETQIECFENAKEETKFEKSKAKDLVYQESLKHQYNKRVHDHIYSLYLIGLEKLISLCHINFVKHLENSQKETLHQHLADMARKLNLPTRWEIPPSPFISKSHSNKVKLTIRKK